MNFAAMLILGAGLSVGQPPADVMPYKKRTLAIGLDVKPDQIAKVSHLELYASRDRGGVWEAVAQARPEQTSVTFAAKEDGLYWVSVVTVYKDGKLDPPNVAAMPPQQKLLIDSTPPVLRITTARREGDEIAVDWSVEDANPYDAKTKVEYRVLAGADPAWKTVPVTAADRRGTRFNSVTNAPLQVRVTVEDCSKNATIQTADVAGVTTAAFVPSTTTEQPKPPSAVDPFVMPHVGPATVAPGEPMMLTPPSMNPAPVAEVNPAAKPLAVGSGVAPVSTVPVAAVPFPNMTSPELPAAQVVNFVKFDLPYNVEAGPSGISRVDLYVTRDDGATWTKWSEHDGRESPLKVALDKRHNAQPEGTYGFRLVPVSGAGLSEASPGHGTLPDFRVQIDLTPPVIKIFAPEADPAQRDILVLKWEATDRNFGKDPIALEWSEAPAGPWKPIGAAEALIPVAGGTTNPLRIANTGTYAWKLPANLPTHKVYLKVTAWDAAGNKSEVATPTPVLVDLLKPKARIQGLMPTVVLKP